MTSLPSGWSAYYRAVRRIPRGRVSTYGAIALASGKPRAARHVGFALAALRGARHDVPWQRVLGARPGGTAAVSILDPMGAAMQRRLLEDEGVVFDRRDRVDLSRFGWPATPRAPASRARSPRRTRESSGRRRTSRSARR